MKKGKVQHKDVGKEKRTRKEGEICTGGTGSLTFDRGK